MKKILTAAFSAAFVLTASSLFAQEEIFNEAFNGPEAITRFDDVMPANAKVAEKDGKYFLQVNVPADSKSKSYSVKRVIPLGQVKGKTLKVSAMVKADDVTKPKDPWNGIKIMVYTDSPTKGKLWKNYDGLFGTFDWKKVEYEVAIPEDTLVCQITFGLQDSTGTVSFDDILITAK